MNNLLFALSFDYISTDGIHLIPKWRPINYSFLCMLISPLCLIFSTKFFCFLHMLTRRRGLINNANKRIIYWLPFWNKVYTALYRKYHYAHCKKACETISTFQKFYLNWKAKILIYNYLHHRRHRL